MNHRPDYMNHRADYMNHRESLTFLTGLYHLLRAAPLIFELVVPREARLARLVSEYAGTTDTHPESPNISELQAAVAGLRKRLGGERVKRALSLLEANDFHSVAGGNGPEAACPQFSH